MSSERKLFEMSKGEGERIKLYKAIETIENEKDKKARMRIMGNFKDQKFIFFFKKTPNHVKKTFRLIQKWEKDKVSHFTCV